MHLVNGFSTCKLPLRLDVQCKDGYSNRGSSCVQQTTLKEKLVLAVSLGIVLGLCVGILLYLVRKHPERAKKIIGSFVRKRVHGFQLKQTCYAISSGTEVKLACKIFFEVPLSAWVEFSFEEPLDLFIAGHFSGLGLLQRERRFTETRLHFSAWCLSLSSVYFATALAVSYMLFNTVIPAGNAVNHGLVVPYFAQF